MQNYIQNNWVEISGAILSLIYLYLSIKQKASLWIFGLMSSVLYVVVFIQSKLYADMSLQFYYVFISIYGWINWKFGREVVENELPVKRLSRKMILILIGITILIYGAYFVLLNYFTDSKVPKFDSLIGALSVVATWMLARKYIENWLVWIVADGLAIGLFVYKELYPTAILFIVYTVMSVVGYRQWSKPTVR
ncbi:MAG TPA: nicotinamide riboside transporter PnuC [Paludibacter sp.]|nr:nicotinamide riboside transporter PnuC [Paludibacter sp.]